VIVAFSNGARVDAEIPRNREVGQRGRATPTSMLFDPGAYMTMEGVAFPLDFVVFNRSKTVMAVAPAVPPGARAYFPGARAVLEMPAGLAAKLGIRVGMTAGWGWKKPAVVVTGSTLAAYVHVPTSSCPACTSRALRGLGQCPTDPPVGGGWHPVANVTPPMRAWAVELLHTPSTFPIGSQTTRTFDGRTVLAAALHHTWTTDAQGNVITGVCLRGITLFEGGTTAPHSTTSSALQVVQYAGLAAALFGIAFTASHAIWKSRHERHAAEAKALAEMKQNPRELEAWSSELEARARSMTYGTLPSWEEFERAFERELGVEGLYKLSLVDDDQRMFRRCGVTPHQPCGPPRAARSCYSRRP
jgi:uncharacterized membrane protein (UPF0127 family)